MLDQLGVAVHGTEITLYNEALQASGDGPMGWEEFKGLPKKPIAHKLRKNRYKLCYRCLAHFKRNFP